jgi:hypothetical protein
MEVGEGGDRCWGVNIPVVHCTEDPIDVFPEMKLRGLVPNFHILVSVSDLYIPTKTRSVHLFCCSKIGRPILGIYNSLTVT